MIGFVRHPVDADQFVFDIGVVLEPETADQLRYTLEAGSRLRQPTNKGDRSSALENATAIDGSPEA